MYRVTAQTSSLSARFRKSSQHSRRAFRMALSSARFAAFASAWLSVPLLFLLTALPRFLLFSFISPFHHLLDLAQIVMTRTCLLGVCVCLLFLSRCMRPAAAFADSSGYHPPLK